MPLLDLPLERLRTYEGRNPCPADFAAFWDRSLAELAATPAQVERRPAAFTTSLATCEHLFFTGTQGARIHAKLLTPRGSAARGPGLVAFHGYTGSSGDWIQYLPYVAAGFTVAALDCRGQGGLSEDIGPARGGTLYGHIVKGLEDVPERLYYRNVFLDTVRLAEIVAALPSVDPARLASTGNSQGGALSLACASLCPQIAKCVALHPFLCDYQRVWEMDLAKDAYVGLTEFFRRFDPRHERAVEYFTRLGYIDIQHHAHRIRAQVLMATGLADPICPPSTQFAAFNKISSPKNVRIYPDFRHEAMPGFADEAFAFLCDGWMR